MIELKPCPFCGGTAKLLIYPIKGYEGCFEYHVRCQKCNTAVEHGRYESIYRTEEQAKRCAIKAWNKRESPWHTEAPIEEGWYVFQFHDSSEMWLKLEYLTVPTIAKMNEKKLFNNSLWQKIELYKEKQDGKISD